jgi:polysaccharide pyruvyl transferase WcaK-like protein
MKHESANIGLLNHIGGGNLGDDATLAAVIYNIRRRLPDAVITALSVNPDDTAKRHGVPSYPIRLTPWTFGYKPGRAEVSLGSRVKALARRHKGLFFLLRTINTVVYRLPKTIWRELMFMRGSRRVMGSLDLLIISGGGQLTEWGGPWAFPYTIFKWILLAKSARVKCLFLNVGAGPLTGGLSKTFVTRALQMADYVSFRDSRSLMLAREIGFRGEAQVFPDSVYSLTAPSPSVSLSGKRAKSVVGIAPMPYCDPRVDPAEKNQTVYEDLICKLSIFASCLAKQSHSIALFGTDIGVDPLAIQDYQVALRNRGIESQYERVDSLDELLSTISAMDYVVTCRFHGIVLAHLLNKPVLAIAHHPKVTNLMNDLGLSEYCVDIRTFDPNLLADTFASLVGSTRTIKSHMAASLAEYRSQLTGQLDSLSQSFTVLK